MLRGSYLTETMRNHCAVILVALSVISAAPAYAQTQNKDILGDNYGIMVPEKGYKPSQPEPWLAPKYESPRGTVKRAHTETDERAIPERTGPCGFVCAPDRACIAEFADGVRIGKRRGRDFSRSCRTLRAPIRCLWAGGGQSCHLHGDLRQSIVGSRRAQSRVVSLSSISSSKALALRTAVKSLP